jgi:hypothetical protein
MSSSPTPIRLHRTRTEDQPALEPMLNDLRARRFRYTDSDPIAMLDELASATTGFSEEVADTKERDWDRTAARLPGEQRTARWLVRQAMHEGVHHLADIRRIAQKTTEATCGQPFSGGCRTGDGPGTRSALARE